MQIIGNEKIKYILSFLAIAVFFGFLFFTYEKKGESNVQSKEKTKSVSMEEEIKEFNGEAITNMESNLEICQAGSRIVYLDRENGKYRTENNQAIGKIYAVFDGENFYSWNDKNPEGTKFSIECMDSLNMESDNELDADEEEMEYEDFLNFEGIRVIVTGCKKYEEEVSFNSPDNIKFYSYCELLKEQMNMLKK